LLIVTKAGGRVLEKGFPPTVAEDVKRISENNRFIFIHGGGMEVTDLAKKLGKEQRFVVSPDGFRSRYTDRETADIYTMVMAGKLNKQVVMALERKGVNTVGLTGLDGHLLRAERKKRLIIINERGRKMVIDGGYTGRILDVNTGLLQLLLDSGYVPVVSPIALSEESEPLNVDGDRTAASIAGALRADILVLLTDVDGLVIEGKIVPKLSPSEAKEVLPKIGPGMITKIHAATEALDKEVKEVIIASGLRPSPISSAISHQGGTVISNG
jgi:[amino group carrier protein]-L-2-aminoadipate/L-glutamate 6-kinase